MDTSSESDDRTRGNRPRGREAHRRPARDRGRASGSGSDGRTADISEKISTLASTLQDTSRNLTKVDRMLGQYRDHTDDQAEAMALLRENLEESISQLQTQRLSRANGTRSASASASPLHTSDLEADSGSDGQRFYPTSPLRDYTGTQGRRRRSQSASVRFKDAGMTGEDIHTLHQSLRDLRCDQLRLSDDLDREILRRNRSDIDTRRAMEGLTGHMTSQRQSSVSSRVERRLQELEREMHAEQSSAGRERRPDQRVAMSDELQETTAGRQVQTHEREEATTGRLLKAEREKFKVEDMRGELLRTRKEKTELQRARLETFQPIAQPHGSHTDGEEGRSGQRGPDLARREQQQLRMLEQLREIQSRGQAERRETEALLQESTRTRDELKTRAQEAVRQWRAKCRRLQKELEEVRTQTQFHTDKALQAAREKESSQAQLKALSQQTEAARRELAEILGRLAQREEELRRKDVELSETRQRQLSLEQEIREVREASAALGEEIRRQAAVQARLEEENQRLQEQADTRARLRQRDQDTQAELQASLKQMTSANAQLAQRLTEEERSKKELQKGASELQARLTAADAASDKELCGALRIKLDRMKDECDKLAAQLSTKDEAHARLQRKCQLLKQELDDKVRSAERRHASESELVKLEEKVLRMEAEQEAVLTSLGQELDAACCSLARNGEDKLQAISQKPGLVKDPHRWLAETKTKLRWLCEEVRECSTREQRLRKQHQQSRDQLKALRQSRDSEQTALLQRLDQQEKLLHSLSTEKRELLEKSRRKEEEMRSLQDRVLDLEMNTRVALDHLEAIPEKQCLMENFKDLEDSQRQREMVEQRYTKYKEIVWDLQHQLDESKRRIQEYRDEKLDATSRSLKLAALSSSIKGPGTFLSSPLRSDTLSPHKRLTSSDLDDSTVNGAKPLSD
ncbi:hypothetical protein GBF38_005805 [Nibea albiflora]|uniref:Uncharacterized protein n=1 Tax=Nibea albiflora TaxID=240163 RepID=A0ACB7FAC2_NIBAL|nr:hypothetical protein GBF38_005805 [Nibea albiflora]